ncbi:MAG: GNAT family N-acetyltransferase [Marmoricola sp.]
MSSQVSGLQVSRLPMGDARVRTAGYSLLRELRPDLTAAGFDQLLAEGPRQGLTVLLARDARDELVGAALYRVLATSRGRIRFVDDLVTAAAARSTGVGGALFDELELRGWVEGCVRIELDSGVTNQAAHRFYHGRRMGTIALHFGKPLEAP